MSIKLRPLLTLLAGLAIFTLPGWASDDTPDLVGHWELIEQPYDLTIEFKDNGAYIALTKRGVMTGRWEELEESRLSTWNNEQLPRRLSVYSIEGDILTITDASGTQLKHRRLLLAEP